MDLVGFVDRFVVHINLFVFDLDSFSLQSDDPLDKIFVEFPGIFENDDVEPLQLSPWEHSFIQWGNGFEISHLVHEKEISDKQGGFHGPCGDLKSLHDKSHHKEDKDGGFHDEFEIFSKNAFFALSFLFFLFFHFTPGKKRLI